MSSMIKLKGSAGATFEVLDTAGQASILLDGEALPSAAETAVLDGVTPGTVTGSKAVVVNSGRSITNFNNLQASTLSAGSSSGGGALINVFPIAPSAGVLQISAGSNSGDFITTITNVAQDGNYTYSIPNVGASSSFVMVGGAQTITGVKTFSSVLVSKNTYSATGNDTTQTATVTTQAGIVTTGALTTAANDATSVVLTLTGLAAGALVQVTGAGGTNTTPVYVQSAVATANTITVVLRNGVNATTALNGTVAFSYVVLG